MKRLAPLTLAVPLLLAGCGSSFATNTSPDSWSSLEDAASSIQLAGGSCDVLESDSDAQATCGAADHGYYMISIATEDNPDAAFAQRFAAEEGRGEVSTVTLWGTNWAVTCVHNAEANCAALEDTFGEVHAATATPVADSAEIETMAVDSCFDAVTNQVNESGNLSGSLQWTSAPEVEVEGGVNGTASVTGQGNISTKIGIPWEHDISCLVRINGGDPETVVASAQLPQD